MNRKKKKFVHNVRHLAYIEFMLKKFDRDFKAPGLCIYSKRIAESTGQQNMHQWFVKYVHLNAEHETYYTDFMDSHGNYMEADGSLSMVSICYLWIPYEKAPRRSFLEKAQRELKKEIYGIVGQRNS